MKKAFLLLVAAAMGTQVYAQNASVQTDPNRLVENKKSKVVEQLVVNRPAMQARTQAVVWSNDFSSSAGWSRTSGTPSSDTWVIRTTGPGGQFSIPKIQSTTAANGFALFDSDSLCGGNQIANLTNTTPINLSGHPNIVLEFQQQYRRFDDSTFVLVSTNNTSWTRFEVNRGLQNNDFCAGNPETVQVDISSVAGNSATVYIRFQFYSPSSIGTGAGCGYSWMIDDIRIFDKPTNDLKLSDITVVQGPLDTAVGGNVYTAVNKRKQIRPTTFAAQVANIGVAAQPNSRVIATISKGSNTPYNTTFNFGSARANLDSFLYIASPVYNPTNPDTGAYTCAVQVLSDSTDANPSNNTITQSMVIDPEMSSTAFFPPYNYLITKSTSLGTNSFTGGADGLRVAAFYSVTAPDTINWIGVRLAAGTVPGGDVVVTLRDTTGLLANFNATLTDPASFPVVVTSDIYTLTSADTQSRVVWIPIPNTTLTGTNQASAKILSGNKGYYICAELFSNADANRIRVLDDQTVTNPSWSSIIFIPANGGNPARWWTNGNNLGLAASSKAIITKTTELALAPNALYPNPANGFTKMNYTLNTNAAVTITVRDITGRVVLTQSEGHQSAGTYSSELNTMGFTNGIYSVELNAGNSLEVRKLVIQH